MCAFFTLTIILTVISRLILELGNQMQQMPDCWLSNSVEHM